jgi:hypothetical protein
MNQNDEKKKQHDELKQFINYTTQLQTHESTKLNLTAAYHLERLRLFSASSSSTTKSLSRKYEEVQEEEEEEEEEKEANDSTRNIGSNDGNNNSTASTTIIKLLQESIHQLEIQLSNNIIQINDILEEMRCLATDIIIVD